MEVEIDVDDVKIGMFVARLDRPWLGTPFLLEGFKVTDLGEIETLKAYCRSVWVDREGVVDSNYRTIKPDRETCVPDFLPSKPVLHVDTTSVEEELEHAVRARRNVWAALDELIADLAREPKVAIASLQHAVNGISDSIIRNPDACMWLRLIKTRDSYTYQHLLDTSALAITFGRHLGFSRHELADIGLGALLIDIGKLKLPQELLAKTTKLSEPERTLVRKHVDYSLKLLEQVPGVSRRVLEIVASHHERFDGCGYPKGLSKHLIPPFARMVAIADFFDAVTSDRPYASGVSPHQAMRWLYDECDKSFQRDLVEQFIQCIGIYPTGTLVELNTGEVGIIVGQNRVRRLKPRLMLILDADKKTLGKFHEIDLMETSPELKPGDGGVHILRSVEPGDFGIDPRQFYMSKDHLTPDFLRSISGLA